MYDNGDMEDNRYNGDNDNNCVDGVFGFEFEFNCFRI